MKIEIDVLSTIIANTMVAAIEHNHMTGAWCAGIYWQSKGSTPPMALPGPWYANPLEYEYEAKLRIEVHEIVDESKPAVGRNLKVHVIDAAAMKRGIALMARQHGRHFGNMLNEDGDCVTADVFLQCVALGELRYG